MHIKTLTIQGFKSYRDQTAVEPFSSGHNVVVGRNGSGKSNFFAAIRFVLSDAYTSMSREDRQSLLHEGMSTSTTLSAYVEIVFDNEDRRFPTGRDEVTLRRTIGLKKDEYSVDRKSSNKAEVMNLLESAGFSKSNPYYIVPQGRITFLTNAKDTERLDLLKEVAGTTLYDEKKAESLKTLASAEAKKAKMVKTLEAVDTRLSELEEEQAELKEFQEKDRDRRSLEYAIYSKELEEIGTTLDNMEGERAQNMNDSNQRRQEFIRREKIIQQLENTISENRQQLSLLSLSSHQSEIEMRDLVRSLTEVECLIDDLNDAAGEGEQRRGRLETELDQVETRIGEVETELAEVEPEWRQRVQEEKEEKQTLDTAKARLDAIYAKQTRTTQFRTQALRDDFLRSEIKNLEDFQRGQEEKVAGISRELEDAQEKLREAEAGAEELRTGLEERKEKIREWGRDHGDLKEEEGKIADQRKELWREDAKLESTVSHAREELKAAERHLASMMDRDTASGLRNLDAIVDRLNLDGVYGPLYKLFEVDDKYSMAVEETAGTSLFHVVVDTDSTASRLVEVMNAERSGRLTFIPLNRVRATPHTYPQTNEVTPLIRRLRFDQAHSLAFEQVFGSTVVANDLHIATAYRRSHGLNVITLDGDKADRKGALTGGFHDVRRSRISAIKAEKTWRTKHDADAVRLAEVKQSIAKIEQDVTRLIGRMQNIEQKRKQAMEGREPVISQLGWAGKEIEQLKSRIGRLEKAREECGTDVTTLEAKREALRAELGTQMTGGLSAEEEEQLESLGRQVEELQKSLSEKATERGTITSRKNGLEIELNESLRRRRDALRTQIDSIGDAVASESLRMDDVDTRKREQSSLKRAIADLEKLIAANDTKKEELLNAVSEATTSLESIQTQQTDDGRVIARSQKVVERYISKRQTLNVRKDECTKLIRDLGVLPEDAFEKYRDTDSAKLLKRLHKVKTSLSKFSNVNKKALQMYEKYSKQRDDIYDRFDGMQASADSIHSLIESLDKKKDAAIENTFGEVSRHFGEIFEKLVPAGRGRLIMIKKKGADDEDEDEDEDATPSAIDSYTGVSIKVSFNSKSDEGLRIQQLSGGQKALVALATVFAIQKCDPAPFYLFDEIDANLDAQYRTAVAEMIHELSSTAQFITTTFRPEMIAHADNCYGVIFDREKVSSIKLITRENAMEFVEQQAA